MLPFIQTSGGGGSPSQAWNIRIVTADATAAISDFIFVDTGLGPITITLPTASSSTKYSIRVKKITADANAVTVARAGGDLIDGQTSWHLGLLESGVEITSNGIGWFTS